MSPMWRLETEWPPFDTGLPYDKRGMEKFNSTTSSSNLFLAATQRLDIMESIQQAPTGVNAEVEDDFWSNLSVGVEVEEWMCI